MNFTKVASVSSFDQIEFSILVPIRNLQSRLKETLPILQRLIEQNNDFEIILGDDCSEDASRRLLESLPTHNRIKLYLSQVHLGRSAMRNHLSTLARGQWLIFLDGDCIPNPAWAQNYRTAASVHTQGIHVGHVIYENHHKSGLAHYLSHHSGPSRFKKPDALSPSYFTTGNSMVALKAFKEVGGFNESYRGWGGEDYDLGVKLHQQGYPLYFANGVEVIHPAIKIQGYFDRLRQFGAENLRKIIQNFPEQDNIFHIKLLQNSWISFSIFRTPVWKLLRFTLSALDFIKWPPEFYRAAIFSSYAEGHGPCPPK